MRRTSRHRRRRSGAWILLPLAGVMAGLIYAAATAVKSPPLRHRPPVSGARTRPEVEREVMRAFQQAGIDTALARIEWSPAATPGNVPATGDSARVTGRWEVPLPAGYDATRARQAFVRAVGDLQGRLTREEPDSHQVFLAASLTPAMGIEALLMSKALDPNRPRMALLVDRFGYRNLAESLELMKLEPNLTVAIAPHTTGARDLAGRCRKQGLEVLLNLPMEGLDYPRVDPGPNAILVDTPPAEIRKRVLDGFDEIGGATGAHTLLGALAVEDRNVMEAVLGAVASREAYFVESASTPYSIVSDVAREIGVPHLQLRDNLDARNAPVEAVRKNLEDLAHRAEGGGAVAGLIHPFPVTVTVLRMLLPEWRRRGIDVVHLSEIVPAAEGQKASSATSP